MARVMVGSARIDERGRAHGGKAGDQGREVATQAWYKHSKGWVLLRAKNPIVRGYIADAMQAACDNRRIGYDQYQRLTLYNQVKDKGFDPAKATKPCETDCSALVRVCALYAFGKCGIYEPVKNFTTHAQAAVLVGTGWFDKLTEWKYTAKSDYLKRGDILVTKRQGHTVVVMDDGAKAEPEKDVKPLPGGGAVPPKPAGRTTLYRGAMGEDVKAMQRYLLIRDEKALPKYGADGDFGAETLTALKQFQKANDLEADGICGPLTWAKLALAVDTDPEAGKPVQEPEEPEPVPEGYPVYGRIIDISDNQGKINFAKLKDNVDYVIARATLSTKIDSRFRSYAKSMEEHGIPYGAYIFTKAQSVAAAQEEAKAFWDACKGLKPTAWFVDVEAFRGQTCSPKERRTYVKTLVLQLRELGADKVGLYCGRVRFNNSLWRIRELFDVLWIADWGKNDGYLRRIPGIKCELHQYTSFGNTKPYNKVPGIPGRVDLDRVCGPGVLESLTGRKYREDTYPGILQVKALNLADCVVRAEPNKNARALGKLARGTYVMRAGFDVEGWFSVYTEHGNGWVPMDRVKEVPEG